MSDILLDNRLTINITAIKGDSLAPISFIFKDTVTGSLEDFTNCLIICHIYKIGADTPIRDLTQAELTVDTAASKVTIQLSALTTATLDKVLFKIKKVIGTVSTTRIKGIITFNA